MNMLILLLSLEALLVLEAVLVRIAVLELVLPGWGEPEVGSLAVDGTTESLVDVAEGAMGAAVVRA